MQHLDEGTIHAWLDGALDSEEAARVERHVSECAPCAAAAAEARGLVAGASRILGALDHTPGGVIPGTARPSSGSAKSSRPLWRVLHFTPARAAAAALLIVAAGTVLVARHAPNDARAVFDAEAGPDVLEPKAGVGRMGSKPEPIKAASPVPAPAPPAVASRKPRLPDAQSLAQVQRSAADSAPVSSNQVAQHAAPTVAPAPAPVSVDSMSVSKMAIASNAARSADKVAATAGAAGAAAGAPGRVSEMARASLAPTADAEQRSRATTSIESLAGCYTVDADSAAGLPARIALDSARAEPAVVGGRRFDSAFAPRRSLRILGAARTQSSSWEPIGENGVRLVFPGSAATPLELHRVSPTTLTGTKTIDNRVVTITLRRAGDCPKE